MPNSFQIFLFKLEGIAETKPPPPSRRSPPAEIAAKLSQAANQLSQLAVQLSQAAAQPSPLTARITELATQLHDLARQVSEVSILILQAADLSPGEPERFSSELALIANQLALIANQLAQEVERESPSITQLNHAAIQLSQLVPQLSQAATQLSRPADELSQFPSDENSVHKLNEKADEIAQNLQREIARLLRSSASVQAEIRFYEGSIILAGTITIISWLAPIVLASARKSFEDGLTHIIGAATRRVLQPMLRSLAPQAEPIRDIEVTPQPVVSASTPSAARSLPSFLQRIPTFDGPGLFLLFMTLTSLALLALIIIFIVMLASGSHRGIRIDVDTRRTGVFVAPAGALSTLVHSEPTAVSPPVGTRFSNLPA